MPVPSSRRRRQRPAPWRSASGLLLAATASAVVATGGASSSSPSTMDRTGSRTVSTSSDTTRRLRLRIYPCRGGGNTEAEGDADDAPLPALGSEREIDRYIEELVATVPDSDHEGAAEGEVATTRNETRTDDETDRQKDPPTTPEAVAVVAAEEEAVVGPSHEEHEVAVDVVVPVLSSGNETMDDTERSEEPTTTVASASTKRNATVVKADRKRLAGRKKPSTGSSKSNNTRIKSEVSKAPAGPSMKNKTTITALNPVQRKPKKQKTSKKAKMPPTAASDAATTTEATAEPSLPAPSTPPTAEVTVTATRPPPPPNGLYRLLLRRGRLGQSLVLTLVLAREWLRLYVPPLDRGLDWLYDRFAPDFVKHPRRHGVPPPPRQRGSRRAWARGADAAALQALRAVSGGVARAKYRYCSAAFLRRHGLGAETEARAGAASATASATARRNRRGEDPALIQVVSQGIRKTTHRKVVGEEDETEDEVGWILQALTTDPPVVSEVTGGTGTSGMLQGLDAFDDDDGREALTPAERRRVSIRRVLLESADGAVRYRAPDRSKPRLSDRDSGVLGRIRAGVGSNSVSRSLFGAYPGDAVPISEAASPKGVIELAKRYGYGDWSDDDDENDGGDHDDADWRHKHDNSDEGLEKPAPSKRKRRRKSSFQSSPQRKQDSVLPRQKVKSRRRPETGKSKFSVNFEFGLGGSQTLSRGTGTQRTNVVARTGQRVLQTPSDDTPSYLTPADRLQIHGNHGVEKDRKGEWDSLLQDRKQIRRSDETGKLERNSAIRPAMAKLNELKKDRIDQNKAQIRPAMELLNESKKTSPETKED